MANPFAAGLVAALLAALSAGALAQGNPADIRARDDAERAQRNYRDAIVNRDAAISRERDALIRSQSMQSPPPTVPPIAPTTPWANIPGAADPALRIQNENSAQQNQWQADQARQQREAAERAARDAKRHVR